MSTSQATPVEQNPVEVPLYTVWDAARYLRVPLWAVYTLSGRFRGWPDPELFFYHSRHGFPDAALFDGDPPFPLSREDRNRLSFHRFAELFVRAATLQVLVEWSRVGRRAEWENLYHAVWRGLEDTHREPVPFAGAPAEDRASSLAKQYDRGLDQPQLALLRKWFTLRLERVEVRDGLPARLYPFSRDPAENSPRTIVLDPRVRFGRPTITGRSLPTDNLFERFQAGDSIAELADDYELPGAEIEEAIRYEAILPAPLLPFYSW